MSPALAGGFLTTAPPGKSQHGTSLYDGVLCSFNSDDWLVFTDMEKNDTNEYV